MQHIGPHGQNLSIDTAQTITIPTGANMVMLTATGQSVRFTMDSATPTTIFGSRLLGDGAAVTIQFNELTDRIKVIGEAAGAAVDWQFFGPFTP